MKLCSDTDGSCINSELPQNGPKWTSTYMVGGSVASIGIVIIIAGLVFHCKKKRDESEIYAGLSWKINLTQLQMLSKEHRGSMINLSSHNIGSSQMVNQNQNNSKNSLRKTSGESDPIAGPAGTQAGLSSTKKAGEHHHFKGLAFYSGHLVAVRKMKTDRPFQPSKSELILLKRMRELHHDNINVFMGMYVEPFSIIILWKYCEKGSLQDIVFNLDIQLDLMFKYSILKDLVRGMEYLHQSSIGLHGDLRLKNCLVDNRWLVKISNFGMKTLFNKWSFFGVDQIDINDQLLLAPELLRADDPEKFLAQTTKAVDVYSYAMIMYQVLFREHAYMNARTPLVQMGVSGEELIEEIKNSSYGQPLRPLVPKEFDCNGALLDLMRECWDEDPNKRPEFVKVKTNLYNCTKEYSQNLMDHMISMLEKYANNLEKLIEERTGQLMEERRKAETLLYQMLPRSVADDLKAGKHVAPETYDNVTVYFSDFELLSDIVGFTTICSASSPFQVVDFLNQLYTGFDSIIGMFDVYKVETIGDAYMCVSGLPKRNGKAHIREVAEMALAIRELVQNFKIPHLPQRAMEIRIGMHSGSVAAGVVGLTMPRYCLFGDTVNTASRMESTSLPMKIQITEAAKTYLSAWANDYNVSTRGTISVKGKGELVTYWLDRSEDSTLRRKSHYPIHPH